VVREKQDLAQQGLDISGDIFGVLSEDHFCLSFKGAFGPWLMEV
jgi:hypothetical protein